MNPTQVQTWSWIRTRSRRTEKPSFSARSAPASRARGSTPMRPVATATGNRQTSPATRRTGRPTSSTISRSRRTVSGMLSLRPLGEIGQRQSAPIQERHRPPVFFLAGCPPESCASTSRSTAHIRAAAQSRATSTSCKSGGGRRLFSASGLDWRSSNQEMWAPARSSPRGGEGSAVSESLFGRSTVLSESFLCLFCWLVAGLSQDRFKPRCGILRGRRQRPTDRACARSAGKEGPGGPVSLLPRIGSPTHRALTAHSLDCCIGTGGLSHTERYLPQL